MDKELEDKVSNFIESQDGEQLRILINMGEGEEMDVEWKRDFHYALGMAFECSGCRYSSPARSVFTAVVCSKHDAVVGEKYSCDLYEGVCLPYPVKKG